LIYPPERKPKRPLRNPWIQEWLAASNALRKALGGLDVKGQIVYRDTLDPYLRRKKKRIEGERQGEQ
jgi:hypothetical protein